MRPLLKLQEGSATCSVTTPPQLHFWTGHSLNNGLISLTANKHGFGAINHNKEKVKQIKSRIELPLKQLTIGSPQMSK